MKPKNPPKELNYLDYLDQERQKIKALPEIERRWYIEEYFPPKCIDHEWDDWEYGGWRRVRGFTFACEKTAQEYLDQHEPSEPGGRLKVRVEVLREVTETKWFPY